jgi:hypothetical protein
MVQHLDIFFGAGEWEGVRPPSAEDLDKSSGNISLVGVAGWATEFIRADMMCKNGEAFLMDTGELIGTEWTAVAAIDHGTQIVGWIGPRYGIREACVKFGEAAASSSWCTALMKMGDESLTSLVLFFYVTKIFKKSSAGSPSDENSKVTVPSSHADSSCFLVYAWKREKFYEACRHRSRTDVRW